MVEKGEAVILGVSLSLWNLLGFVHFCPLERDCVK